MGKAKSNKGQMRVVETILASLVIVFALTFVNIFAVTPYSTRYETSDLEKLGHNALHDLDQKRLLARFVYNEEWENLWSALAVTLPTDVYFNLTVFKLDARGQLTPVNDMLISYGDPAVFLRSNMTASVQYIIPGYQCLCEHTNYDPRIIRLELVRE